jgi:uridine kinase
MRRLYTDSLFLIGLAIRLGLIFFVLPAPVTEWYVPFLEVSITRPTFDPWLAYIEAGGDVAAFPYGYAMWIAFLPLTLVCSLVGIPTIIGYAFTLLFVDLGLLEVFRRLLPNRERFLLAIYWLSPILLLASYWLGLNDLVPVFLLVLSLYFAKQLRLFFSGLLLILAISAKLSMVITLPFFAIYFFRSRALYALLPEFLKGISLALLLVGLPFLVSDSAIEMLLSNPEMSKVYQFTLSVGDAVSIYVVPLVYLIILYVAWRVRRMNFELFQAMLGMSFMLVVLLSPASPGWFLWVLPLLIYYQAISGLIAIVLSSLFTFLYIISTLFSLYSGTFGFSYADVEVLGVGDTAGQPHMASLLHTAMVAVGIVLTLRMWRETVSRNDYFRLSRKPFVIGIAGDSGSGKDTLSDAIEGLFGNHSVAKLSGDDYHLWDRQKPVWQAMTHLNPMANDLEGFASDLVSLIDGKTVGVRKYDHNSGIRSEQQEVKSNDFIVVSGLHTLYLPILRECMNVRIYLGMDEGLRRQFKELRDVSQRGQSAEQVRSSFNKRASDSEKFIRPQSAYADLVLSLQPIHPRLLVGPSGGRPLRFKLLALSRNGLSERSLTRVLIGVCGLHVDIATSDDSSEVELTIEGETSGEDVALAAKMLCPRVMDFLDIRPKWAGGVLGLMQLVTLTHIDQALTKRFL